MTRNLKLSCFNVTEKKANKLIVVNLKSGGIVSLDSMQKNITILKKVFLLKPMMIS